MNPVNRFLLYIVLLPSTLYERMGVNTRHLKSILNAKLLIDDRRPNTFQQQRRRKNAGNVKAATLGTMLISAVMGCFFLFSFFVGKDYELHLTIYFSMYLFILASSLISDFTSVLIDIRDNYIILPKPVTDRTVVTARLLHIMIHISKLVLPMSIPGIVYMAYNTGIWGALLFVILLVFVTLLTIFFINALYIFILKVTTPAKFQGVISYFQIFMTVFVYASYQVVPRLVNKAALQELDIAGIKWIWLAPSYWFAAAWQGFINFHPALRHIIAMALSIVVPLASIYVVIKYFAPSFNQKLSLINSSNTEQTNVSVNAKKITSTTSAYVQTMAKWFTQKGVERMSFLFCWKMTSRSKDFKLKVYPSIGYMLVVLVLPFLRGNSLSLSKLHDSNGTGAYVFVGIVYFSSFLIMQAIQQLTFSDKYKAAWIYFTTPISSPSQLIQGALKAFMVKFYIPIVMLVSAAAMVVTGASLLPNLLLGFINEVFIISLVTYLTVKELPFSVQQNNNSKSGSFVKGLFMLIIPGVVALFHFLIYKFTPVVYILIVLSAIATWLVQGSIRKVSWQKILSSSEA